MSGLPSCLPRYLAIGLSVGMVAGSLLFAQTVQTQPGTTSPAPEPTTLPAAPDETATTQPAEYANRAPQELASGLIGSKHDLTRIGKGGRDLCLPCHTPHQVGVPPPRLDHRPSATLPLRPYQTVNVELTGWSLLCLGCHDGVTAPDVYASPHAISVAGQLGDARLGTRGLRSHPVGITYPVATEGYYAAAALDAVGLPLDDGRIQCTTCHDAHNTHRHPHMLRMSNEGSRLCLTCHRV
jgi:predicted CXXCH cytochrome family protein